MKGKLRREDCGVDKKKSNQKKKKGKRGQKKNPPRQELRTNDEADRGEWRFAIVALAPKSPENGARYRCVAAVEDGNENETEIPEKVMRLDDEELRAQMLQQCTHSAQDRVGIG